MTVLSLRSRNTDTSKWLTRLGINTETLPIIVPPLALLTLGLAMILSASWVASVDAGRSPYFFVTRQMIGLVGGILAMLVCSRLNVAWIKRIGRAAVALSIVGLVLVLTPLGTSAYGSRRWIELGGITFQPSEIAKLGFILLGAELCAMQGDRLRTVKDAIRPVGLLFGVLGGLVILQPDLGTATLLGILYMTLLWVAATPARTMLTMTAFGAAAFWTLAMSAPYRRARVMSFMDPFADPEGAGYQAVNSIVALGSGGLFGTGVGMSRQKWLYVPNAHTDFIYAVIGEELGLFGTVAILAAFGIFAWGGFRVAQAATDPFCRMVAAGITVWIVVQAIVNIGAVTSVLPITGVPLPFVSYGNSALAVSLAAVGILIAIARQGSTKEVAKG